VGILTCALCCTARVTPSIASPPALRPPSALSPALSRPLPPSTPSTSHTLCVRARVRALRVRAYSGSAKTEGGLTAMDWAKAYGYAETAEFLGTCDGSRHGNCQVSFSTSLRACVSLSLVLVEALSTSAPSPTIRGVDPSHSSNL
jgi:hypothetical protein